MAARMAVPTDLPVSSGLHDLVEIEAMLHRQPGTNKAQESPRMHEYESKSNEVGTGSWSSSSTASPSLRASPMPSPPLQQRSWTSVAKPANQQALAETPPRHRTAYLDGLRGFAALLVLILHNQVWARIGISDERTLENAYGWNDKYYFATLPAVRIFFSGGHAAVPVFFIISGYVLSSKPLSLVHQKDYGALAESLCSGLFRRWGRLYVPVAVTSLVWAMSWHIFGIRSSLPGARLPEKHIFDELWMWYCDFKNFSFLFNDKITLTYNHNMWTIPLEFRGSLVVWTALLATAKCTTTKRLMCEAALAFYFLYVVDAWYLCLFTTGLLLCDLDLLILYDQVPPKLRRALAPKPQWLLWFLFAMGVYFAGIPSVAQEVDQLRQQPGWYYLSYLKPQAVWDIRNFYRSIAAILLMTSIPQIRILKRFFESEACQYLGRQSFALYLVHGPVLWSIGDRVYAAVGRIQPHHIGVIPGWINAFRMPGFGFFGLEFNTLAAQLILLPLTFGLAEAVTLLVDTPSVDLLRSIFEWMTGKKKKKMPLANGSIKRHV